MRIGWQYGNRFDILVWLGYFCAPDSSGKAIWGQIINCKTLRYDINTCYVDKLFLSKQKWEKCFEILYEFMLSPQIEVIKCLRAISSVISVRRFGDYLGIVGLKLRNSGISHFAVTISPLRWQLKSSPKRVNTFTTRLIQSRNPVMHSVVVPKV